LAPRRSSTTPRAATIPPAASRRSSATPRATAIPPAAAARSKNNTTGNGSTASGVGALGSNTTGDSNTAVGFEAGETNATGTTNTFIGFRADAFADGITNGTALGAGAVVGASNSIVLGNTSISAIFADVSITAVSDRRRKKDIRALDADLGLDFIEKLKPVSYRFDVLRSRSSSKTSGCKIPIWSKASPEDPAPSTFSSLCRDRPKIRPSRWRRTSLTT
jgi:hypothetical protein